MATLNPTSIQTLPEQFERLWKSQAKARLNSRNKRDMYNNNWRPQLAQAIEKLYHVDNHAKLKRRMDISSNLCRWVVEECSSIYSGGITRAIEATDIEGTLEVDLALGEAANLTYLQGSALVRPLWENGRMLATAVPRECFYAAPHAVDRRRLQGVAIEHRDANGHPQKYECWTEQMWFFLDKHWRYDASLQMDGMDGTNPYGVIPYICSHIHYPTTQFTHDSESDDLYEACLLFGVAATDHMHLRHMQSHKQPVIKDEATKTSALESIWDPATAIHLKGANANAFVLDVQANLSQHWGSLLDKAQFTLAQRGMRVSVLRSGESSSSGYALKIKENDKERVWGRQRTLWDLWDDDFWQVARAVVPVDGGPHIPEGQIERTWPELGIGKDPREVAYIMSNMKNAGILSVAECHRQLGYDSERSQQILTELRDEMFSLAPPKFELPSLPGAGAEGGGD